MRYYVVLDDGETYSSIEGCRIVAVHPDILGDDLDKTIKDKYLRSTKRIKPWPHLHIKE